MAHQFIIPAPSPESGLVLPKNGPDPPPNDDLLLIRSCKRPHDLLVVMHLELELKPLFLCAARTGLRLGELLALQWGDFDFQGCFLLIQRNYIHGKVMTPKGGEVRRVDMSRGLTDTLADLHTKRQLDASANGWSSIPEWVFCSETGGLLDGDNLRHRAFCSLLKASGLRKIRFHDLPTHLRQFVAPARREPRLRQGTDGAQLDRDYG